MAYSLNDLYRPLRGVMRVEGLALGLGLGGLLLISPRTLLALWNYAAEGPVWPVRMAGSLLVAHGLLLLIAAHERIVNTAAMVSMVVANGLLAVVLLAAYLQQELGGLGLGGQALLILIFLLCLVGAVVPLRYLRTDYVVL